MTADSEQHLDKQLLRKSFAAAAAAYDEVAVLQREVGERMLERLDYMRITPERILDLGAGTGLQSIALSKRYRKAKLVALDLAHPMLRIARRRSRFRRAFSCVCGDIASLPIADHSVDMIFSNLALQWCEDLDQVFAEFRRVLKPGGMVLFSTLGPDTLHELRSSWQTVDDYPHVNNFLDMHDIGDAMVRAQLAEPVMDVERITMTYDRAVDLMRDLKTLGAHNVAQARSRGLTGARHFQKVINAYEQFRREGVLPATWEVVYGHAWAPQEKSSVHVSLPVT
ncbi:MAG: malonyl-ACP O-methyltransferase BioC [Granulosicoccaceae bacterium]|jgi:malonyl-CoA O-methyltransferase